MLKDLTSYQFVIFLEDELFFEWRAMPKAKERDASAFRRIENSPRVWCSGKAKVNHTYLRALAVAAREPEQEINEVRHGESNGYYLQILGLQPRSDSTNVLALDDGEQCEFPARKRARRQALEDGEVDFQAIEDAVAEEVEEVVGGLDFDELEHALEAELHGVDVQENVYALEVSQSEPEEDRVGIDEDIKEIVADNPAAAGNHTWDFLHSP